MKNAGILSVLLVVISIIFVACSNTVSPTPTQTPAQESPTPPIKTAPDSISAAELTQPPASVVAPTPEPTSVVEPSMQTQVIVAVPSIHSIADLDGKKMGMNASLFQYAIAALEAYDVKCIPEAIPSPEEFETTIPQKVPSLEECGNVWQIAPESIRTGTPLQIGGQEVILASTPEQQQARWETQQKALNLLRSKGLIESSGGINQNPPSAKNILGQGGFAIAGDPVNRLPAAPAVPFASLAPAPGVG